jgi:hypothetical protein
MAEYRLSPAAERDLDSLQARERGFYQARASRSLLRCRRLLGATAYMRVKAFSLDRNEDRPLSFESAPVR